MISIIIPTFNRLNYLKSTLNSIVKLNCSKNDFEVIVIDNGSTDKTKDLCFNFKSQFKSFIYYYDETPGLLTGRHKGVELATGEILSFIDDDVELSPNWLNGIINAFKKYPGVHLVTGPNLPQFEVSPPEWLDYFWDQTPYNGKVCTWLSLLNFGKSEILINPAYVFGLNFSIRKSALIELGGFNPDCIPSHLQQYQGDGETGLALKANQRGYKALYSPYVLLNHQISKERLSIDYFKKRAFYQGICDSYTKLRRDNNLYTLKSKVNSKYSLLYNELFNITRKLSRKIKRKLNANVTIDEPLEIQKIKTELSLKYVEGYNFHQEAYKCCEPVRKWVLKKDYWNYRLPDYD